VTVSPCRWHARWQTRQHHYYSFSVLSSFDMSGTAAGKKNSGSTLDSRRSSLRILPLFPTALNRRIGSLEPPPQVRLAGGSGLDDSRWQAFFFWHTDRNRGYTGRRTRAGCLAVWQLDSLDAGMFAIATCKNNVLCYAVLRLCWESSFHQGEEKERRGRDLLLPTPLVPLW
jgi:hypothetical protein